MSRLPENPWGSVKEAQPEKRTVPQKKQLKNKNVSSNATTAADAIAKKFQEAQSKHIEAAKKHIANYESSSDEEELASESLLDSVFKGYGGDKTELHKTQQFLENVFQSGTAICLICIATVKQKDFIWSCEHCYSFFHLACIQRWANDSTSQKRQQQATEVSYYTNQGEYVAKEKKVLKWNCPKCRNDYLYSEIPRAYTCFCSKEVNPASHAWLVPHSCGEMCGKKLQPDCGHRCVLLCHPGPCPPCPQIISKTCCCGQSNPRTIRCSQKTWKCLNKCKLKLACGSHVCGLPCHDSSDCPPCAKKSKQRCLCGNQVQERNCNALEWRCDKVCNQPFSCGLHKCEVKCHFGECGDCPLGKPRACPCGKETTTAPCSEETGACGNTCQKLLDCGLHICMERCHKDKCGQCLIITKKECRCGLHSKELPCSKTFTCETKCKQIRDCNKHACNRKCCDNQCPQCDKICGKTLSCGKHKCTSLCHMGQCYPCNQKSTVKCRCGNTTIQVPCGREKKTKPPKCFNPCKIASKCHHENPHRCHANECPPCTQNCLLPNTTTNCEHPCPVRCHDAVKISLIDKNFKPAGPWEKQPEKIVVKKLPHPPCEVNVAVTCIGGHETVAFPCHNSTPTSCGRSCDRLLSCGNHNCQLQCHAVEDLTSKYQDDACAPCQENCIHPRPDGCVHACPKPCHLSKCAVCTINIKLTCHCGMSPVYYKCGDYYNRDGNIDAEKREKMQSCGNRCIRNYDCGHLCTAVCHSGGCPDPESCKKKVKVSCDCKTRKAETTCDRARAGFTVACDAACAAKKDQARLVAEEIERKQRELEEEKNRLELLEYEKKFGKRKYKERKQSVVEEGQGIGTPVLIGVSVLMVCLAIGALFFFELV